MSDATPKFTLTDGQRRTLEELEELRTREFKLTQDQFARKFNYTGPSWSKMVKALEGAEGHYFELVSDADRVFAQLQLAHRRLRQEAAQTRAQRTRPIIKTAVFESVISAIETAAKRTDEKRAVAYLAPFGGGKSQLISLLVREHGARAVETRPTWERSHRTCLTDTGAALGLVFENTTAIATMENAIFDVLKTPLTLCFDEAEFFGKDTINFIKYLLNRTPVVPFFCATQQSFETWLKKYPHEALQLQRRFQDVVLMPGVDPDKDVPEFAKAADIHLDKNGCNLIANAASQFGAYSTVAGVLEELKQGRHTRPDLGEVDAAIDTLFARQRVPRVKADKGGKAVAK